MVFVFMSPLIHCYAGLFRHAHLFKKDLENLYTCEYAHWNAIGNILVTTGLSNLHRYIHNGFVINIHVWCQIFFLSLQSHTSKDFTVQ